MRMRSRTFLNGLLLGAVVAALGLVGPSPHPSPPRDAAVAPLWAEARVPLGEPSDAAPATPDRPSPVRAPERWVKTPLASAFDAATDLRAFAIEAQRRPAEGGVFQALRALAECRLRPAADEPIDAPADAATTHLHLQARAAWNTRAARRCAAFIDAELADAEVGRLMALGLRECDPLAASYARWMDAVEEGTVAAISRALAAALRRQDAGLLELVAMTGQDYLSAGGPADGATDESQVRARHAAWLLLPCEMGAGCTAPHGPGDALCERSARCAQERWRSGPRLDAAPAGSELERTLAELARLKAAVRERDVGAILGTPRPDQ